MADIQTQWALIFKTDELDAGMAHVKDVSNDATKAVGEGWNMAGSAAVDALRKLLTQSEETHGRGKEHIEKATQAADLLNDALGIRIASALQKMAAESEVAGPVLESAFPVLAAIALGKIVADLINKIRDWISALRDLSDEEKDAINAQANHIKKAIELGHRVIEIRRQAALIGKSEGEQARLRAQWAAEDQREDEKYLESARKKYDAAVALLKESEKGEMRRGESYYTNPRTGMRSYHWEPVISDEQVKQAKASILLLEGLYGRGLEDLAQETLLAGGKRNLADKQAAQASLSIHKQHGESLKDLMKKLAADVQAMQKQAMDRQMEDSLRADQQNLRAIQQQNEAIIRANTARLEAAEETIKGEIEAARTREQAEEQMVERQFARGKITKQQEIAALAQLKRQELQIEIEYWRAIAQLHAGDAKEVARIEAQITKLKAQQELIRAKAAADSAKAQGQQYQKMAATIHQVFSGLQGVFSNFTRSILSGSQTIGQAWIKLVDDIAARFIEGLEKQLMSFIEHKVLEIAIHAQAETTKEEVSKTTSARNDLRTAYSAAKNAFKATAGIDFIGPVLAPIAAASAFAAVVAFGSAEGGQYLVPGDQLTMLHRNEMVLPAGVADRMRGVIDGGGGGGISVIVHHSVNAVDADSFRAHIRRHANLIGNEVARVLKRKRES
jgi:hypothetical protein